MPRGRNAIHEGNAWILWTGVGLGVIAYAVARSVQDREEPETGPPDDLQVLSIPGFRRAARSEIPPEILGQASSFLSQPLMSVHNRTSNDGRRFAYGVEEHYNETKGVHKGVSIFVER